jgi:O-antigen/teichoic acid export membrane protein
VLAPEDFGLFGIAMLVISMADTFSATGFEAALIQKNEDIKPYLDTAWTIQFIRGVLLSSIVVLGAPFIAEFFDEPGSLSILRALGLILFIKGLMNIGVVYFVKELEFQKRFLLEFAGQFIDMVIAVTAALILRNVWALILGLMMGTIIRVILSYSIQPIKPRFNLQKEKASVLFNFGKWVFGSSILVFLITEADDLVVATIVGATALGYYQMAYKISNMPSTHLTMVLNQVAFPTFSKIQNDIGKLRRNFLKSFSLTAVVVIPIVGIICVLAYEITIVLLGEKWLPIVPSMQVLAIWGGIRALGGNTSPLLQAIGKPKLITWFQFFMFLSMAIMIFPLTNTYGILGTALSVTIGNFIIHWLRYPIIAKEIQCSGWSIYRLVLFPLVASTIMSLILFLVKTQITSFTRPNLLGLILLVIIGGLIYLTIIYLFSRLFQYNIFARLIEILNIITKSSIGTTSPKINMESK